MKEEQNRVLPIDWQTESDRYLEVSTLFDLGWWELDIQKSQLTCSASVANLLGLGITTIDAPLFFKMIREDYRSRIVEAILAASGTHTHQYFFPIYISDKVEWITIRFKKTGEHRLLGVMITFDEPEEKITQETARETVKNLIHQLNGITKSLFSFLQRENFDDMVNHILSTLVTHFSAERAYIFEYNWKDMNQSCTYEAVSRPGLEEIENLTEMFFEPDTWWNQQILTQQPIILSSLDDLPTWDLVDRDVLESQNIKSLMVVPFVSKDNQIWGYAGIDVVDKQRNWSEEDFQWFSSLMHIINICVELQKSKGQILDDKEYLQKLYKRMPIGYLAVRILYDEDQPVDFTYTEANDELGRIIDIAPENIIGMKGSDLFMIDDLSSMLEVVNTDKHVEFDFPLPSLDRHCRVIRFSLHKDEVISLVLDVTDVHNAHKAVAESEKLLRTIYENLPVGLELYDEKGGLLYRNDKNLEILELDAEDNVIGLNLFDHPCLPQEVKKKIRKGEKADFNLIYDFSLVGDYYKKEFPPMEVKNLTIKIVPIFDENRKIQNYLFININNTETTNAYQRIQEFEAYFSMIANLAKVGYFKWNLTTKEGFGISQWFTSLGKPANSLMTDDLADMYSQLHPEDFEAIKHFYDKAASGRTQSFEKEIRVIEKNKVRWLRCTLTSKKDPVNGHIELIGVSYDITELKEMILAKDKAEALDRLKSAFLANMSHEIRTPLNSIIGFSDLLVETQDEDEKREYISIIRHNNDLLLKIVSDVLDLSNIESGTMVFEKREVSVRKLCGEVVRLFNAKEIPPGIEMKMEPLYEDHVIYTDADRVKQVLENFVTNSLKFTKRGSITLGCEHQEDDTLLFYVKDTGIGISPEDIDSIFERFVKIDSFAQGTGVGLSICKSLIEGMGGTIGVDSEPGKGSCFWFTLPIA
ncbi:signal transduction histidine kinase [Parabacteroides sp. PFB2-12]|uniref:sensor histidine kinase n=1 Tax=unclassified Parabacteroides TaxID=2649774 RepID=UPI0024738AA2|nr:MULTISPECIES: ATP-binding protein [unclassified Parabacteroides]MDH6343600.1 signal transduction histidine kinase [Parabacteroides sp. PM6-13]MDH6391419.1 signal transduction histidine kinase [Parabacteroides sp. PFB2-12]